MSKIVVTGVILAGGQSRQMNGRDKGLIQIAGKPLYQYAITKLLPQVDYLCINANRNITEYQQAGYPVIVDTIPDSVDLSRHVSRALCSSNILDCLCTL